LWGIARQLNETLTNVEVLANDLSKPFTESLSLTDSDFSTLLGNYQTFLDILSTSEAFVPSFAKNYIESISLTDTFKVDYTQPLQESLNSVEYLSKSVSTSVSIDNTALSESLIFSTQPLFTEATLLVEALIKSLGTAYLESLSLVEISSLGTSKPFSENMALTETGSIFNDNYVIDYTLDYVGVSYNF
jgi:hypothetical protein